MLDSFFKPKIMKKILLSLLIVAGLFACTNNNSTDETTNDADSTKVDTTINAVNEDADVPVIALSDFEKQAEKYIDKKVEISGLVDHVCKHGGKKLLLVNDSSDVHVESENRFEDTLVGNTVSVIGIVKEFRVDEAYCQKEEKEDLNEHSEGKDKEEMKERKQKMLQFYRDSMKNAGVDHLSFYSLEFVSFK